MDHLHNYGHDLPMHSHRLSLESEHPGRRMHQLKRVLFHMRPDKHSHCCHRFVPATTDSLEIASFYVEKNRTGVFVHHGSIVCGLAKCLWDPNATANLGLSETAPAQQVSSG